MPKLKLLKSNNNYVLITIATLIIVYIGFASYSYFVVNKFTFPNNTFLANTNVSKLDIKDSVGKVNEHLKNTSISILINDTKINSNAYDLGIYVSKEDIINYSKTRRLISSFLPIISIPNNYNKLSFDEFTYKNNLQSLMPKKVNPPLNAGYDINAQNEVIVTNSQNGNFININDYKDYLYDQIAKGQTNIELNAQLSKNISPAITTEILQNKINIAKNIYQNQYKLYNDETIYTIDAKLIVNKLSLISNNQIGINLGQAKEIISSYASTINTKPTNQVTTNFSSGRTPIVTQDGQIGQSVNNIDDLSNKLVNSINTMQGYMAKINFNNIAYEQESILLDDVNKLGQMQYKINFWGNVGKDELDEFSRLVNQTLNDGRGWAKTGIAFQPVNANADFEIILSEAGELPKRYPNICDSFYSCRVGRYVIINVDRWKQATPVWTLSLRDYRHLVVNHEVGHLLGLGHPNCPANDQLAPAMLQQSINLEGCTFNPWPLSSEISLARQAWLR